MATNRKLHGFEQAVAEGGLTGHEPVNIFGFNSLIDGTFIPAWENNTVYTYPVGAITMSLQSTDIGDTATILVDGLDANHVRYKIPVTLTGTTPVVISPDLHRINTMVTISGNAVGTVTATNGGTVYAQINPGVGKTQMSLYTVPAGHSFFLYRIDAWSATTSGASKYLLFRNQLRLPNGTNLTVAQTTFVENMNVVRIFPLEYTAGTDIQFQFKSSSGVNEIGSFVEGVLIANE